MSIRWTSEREQARIFARWDALSPSERNIALGALVGRADGAQALDRAIDAVEKAAAMAELKVAR